MADLEIEFDDDLIAVDDHDRQQRLMASRDGRTWRVLEGPINGSQSLLRRTTAETPTQVLVEVLRWLTEDDEPPLFACERYIDGAEESFVYPIPDGVDHKTATGVFLFPNGDRATIHKDRLVIEDDVIRVRFPKSIEGDIKIKFDE